MALTLRHMQPCRRCPGLLTCELVDRELGNALERLAWMNAKTGRKLPDLEIVLDCRLFSPQCTSSSNTPAL